ncbi:MAG: dihydrodipicolinate synthase family protein [Chloroflexi bacterium]|nr:dihydrodipicolinate synthase family protein [Chloroflexota bacterium]MCY3581973.1 dihydrodipicolinate synthase family protein [Chloroflexota bacterium]MCY3715974.1 dihydrodipicolinate synthase family protein [Chloroflexota bacterium]MDE2651545.1 dihydrodipicolinate synthase family protein [Chloroflexota bacterium]MXX51525.1 dihydrodipicolinate synthase family protein [Chloroflexota bacterium]
MDGTPKLAGIYQILQTPFSEQGDIDWGGFARQIDFCLAVGVHGLVVPALASEFFTLSDAERRAVVEFAAGETAGRIPLVAGVQGLTLRSAQEFAEHAAECGVTALMAMPPYLRKASKPAIHDYYRQLAQYDRPLIIQNAPAPIGSPLSPRELCELLALENGIQYIKEETVPILQHISEIIALDGGHCQGVFGGANGIYLLDELQRGACGNMPAGGFVDLQVKIYDLYRAGDIAEAERMHFLLLPLLNYAMVYGVSLHKFVLWRRGALTSPFARDPQKLSLNADDIQAVEKLWRRIADITAVDYPFL